MNDGITSVRERWIASLNDESVEGFVECVTPKAVWLPPHGEATEGREAIAHWLDPLFKKFSYDFTVSNVRVRNVGGWAIEDADFETILTEKGTVGEPLVHRGTYLVLWRRVEEGWLIDRYVDRTGIPL